jgi:hypothetical protein
MLVSIIFLFISSTTSGIYKLDFVSSHIVASKNPFYVD